MNVRHIKSKMIAAFSLIELMVVIAIVAVLTAVALPSYQQYIQQSKVAEIFSLASNQMALFAQYYNAGSSFDVCNSGASVCTITTGTNPTNTTAANVGNYIGYVETWGNGSTAHGPASASAVGTTNSVGGVIVALTSTTGLGADTISYQGTTLNSVILEFFPTVVSNVSGDSSDTTLTWSCKYSPVNTAAATLFKNFPSGCTSQSGPT